MFRHPWWHYVLFLIGIVFLARYGFITTRPAF